MAKDEAWQKEVGDPPRLKQTQCGRQSRSPKQTGLQDQLLSSQKEPTHERGGGSKAINPGRGMLNLPVKKAWEMALRAPRAARRNEH